MLLKKNQIKDIVFLAEGKMFYEVFYTEENVVKKESLDASQIYITLAKYRETIVSSS